MAKKTVTSVAIRAEYLKKMDEIKEELGIPKNKIIDLALTEYFKNHDFESMF